jgi:type II secretory pathway pseudopilin PulG
MTRRSNTSSPPPVRTRRRRATTLVEVLLGLALLAALLVSILTARSRAARQTVLARAREDATRSADRLLTHWWADPTSFPRSATGVMPDAPQFTWRTRVVENPSARSLGASVVRLEVSDPDAPEILVAVEVLLPSRDLRQ